MYSLVSITPFLNYIINCSRTLLSPQDVDNNDANLSLLLLGPIRSLTRPLQSIVCVVLRGTLFAANFLNCNPSLVITEHHQEVEEERG